jgi:hypothetical protein
MENSLFVPVIKAKDGDSLRTSKAALRALFTTLLHSQSCAAAVAKFKSNGSVLGHKVLDDSAAVEALKESAPPELAAQIEAISLTQWDKCQVLNSVLRRYYEMDKRGKLTGQPSKRVMLSQSTTTA